MSDYAELNPAFIAADTVNMQAGSDVSFISRAERFAGSALASGVLSVYNTAANYIGAEKVDVAQWISEIDEDMGAYYRRNRESADIAGFVATSFVPGGLALKGVQLAKSGTALGAFGRALGYAETRQSYYVKQGLEELGRSGGTVFNAINANKLKAMVWGMADNAISVAAMETAVAATMKQSPLLEKDSYADIGLHTIGTSIVFGAIGGGLGSIGVNAIFKTATKDISKAMNEYTAITRFKGDITEGDQAFGILASSLKLPQLGKNLEFEYKLNGLAEKITLPTAQQFEAAATAAERSARLEVETLMTKMADGDVALGQAFSGRLFRIIDEGKFAGKSIDEITEELGDHLMNMGKLRRITADAPTADQNIFYVGQKLKDKSGIVTPSDIFARMISRAPTDNTLPSAYKLRGKVEDVKIGIISDEAAPAGSKFTRYATTGDAFADGMDAVLIGDGLRFQINHKSKQFIRADDTVTSATSFFNTRTGAWSSNAFPTVADLASHTRPLSVVGDRLELIAGNLPAMRMKLLDDFVLDQMDTIQASARYAWLAAKNNDGAFAFAALPQKIAGTDLPMLDRILTEGANKFPDLRLAYADGTERFVKNIVDFPRFVMESKVSVLQEYLARTPGGEDITSLAVKLNAEPWWVQKVIERNFQAADDLLQGSSIALEESLRPQNLRVAWDYGAAIRASVSNLTGQQKLAEMAKLMKSSDTLHQQSLYNSDMMMPLSANNTVFGQLGFNYRVKVAQDQMEAAFAAVMGPENAAKFLELSPDVARGVADQMGAGAGFLKFSNADYGDPLRLWSQYTGQQVNIIAKDAANATLETLRPATIKILDDQRAAAELGVLTNVLRRSSDRYYINPTNPKQLVLKEALGENGMIDAMKAATLQGQNKQVILDIESDAVAEFIGLSTAANAQRIDRQKVLMTAKGFNYNYDPRSVYIPPVDTGRYPFFAFVRQKPGFLGGSSEVSMITAKNAAELKTLSSKIPEDYEVIFKDNVDAFKKAKGEYDYALSIKEPTVDSTLQRRGVLGDYFPEVRAENVLQDWLNWHQSQEVGLVRKAVETRYSQVFAELRAMGEQFSEVATSKFSGALKLFKSQADNPYENYLKTALDISKRSEYTLLHEANEFVESLGKTAYRTFADQFELAKKGTVSWQEANRLSEKFGIAGPYRADTLEAFYTANNPADRSLIKDFVSKANMMLVNFNLRLDFMNSLVNIISTPILLGTEMRSIKSLVASDSVLAGKLAELRSIPVPGTGGAQRVPSTTGLIAESIKDFFGPEKTALIAKYKSIGAIKDVASQYHEMMDMMAIEPLKGMTKVKGFMESGIEKGAKFTASEFAETFTRFVSANVMKKMTDPIVSAGKMTVAEQDAYISVFVNRVQGNYLSSQRPIAFQGVLGSAVSLFQTYQFNLLQQLFRHVENRDAAALGTLVGLQSGLYGLNGIPFFEATNSFLLGSSRLSPEHKDLYSSAPKVAGQELGNWMLYGTASAFPLFSSKAPALYTRGDVNPRHISIIPISPLDVPAVDGSIRIVSNLLNMGKTMANGGAMTSALLEGLEHNGISRPLAGFAQVVQGYSTTSKGSLISANNDFFSVATLSRVAGSKPMDESLALNAMFRLNAYKAQDQAKIEAIGEAVKTKLRSNQTLSTEELQDFQLKVAKAGMRPEQYAEALQRWSKNANASVVNDLASKNKTSYSQRLQEIMGAERLRDFRNSAPVSPLGATELQPASAAPQAQPQPASMQPSLAPAQLEAAES